MGRRKKCEQIKRTNNVMVRFTDAEYGHNGSGNIHVHIIINSLRKLDIEPQSYTTRSIDCKAGYKHHLTKDYAMLSASVSLVSCSFSSPRCFIWSLSCSMA